MDQNFIDTYGVVGYLLRQLDINTSSRIAMLSSLIHLQKENNKAVAFDTFYEYSLDQTDEKLEKSSFGTLVSKLEESTGKKNLIEDVGNNQHKASKELLKMFKKAEKEFSKLTRNLV